MDCFSGAFRRKNAFFSIFSPFSVDDLLLDSIFFVLFNRETKSKHELRRNLFSRHNHIRFRPISCSVAM